MVVLVDAKYYGNMLRFARKHQGIKTNDAAKMLKISVKQLRRYERGLELIPESMLMALFHRGFCLLRCQRPRI